MVSSPSSEISDIHTASAVELTSHGGAHASHTSRERTRIKVAKFVEAFGALVGCLQTKDWAGEKEAKCDGSFNARRGQREKKSRTNTHTGTFFKNFM